MTHTPTWKLEDQQKALGGYKQFSTQDTYRFVSSNARTSQSHKFEDPTQIIQLSITRKFSGSAAHKFSGFAFAVITCVQEPLLDIKGNGFLGEPSQVEY